jgi:hypothetical protein
MKIKKTASGFFKKYKLQLDMIAVIVWGYFGVRSFFFDHPAEKKKLYLFFGIVATLLTIFKMGEVIEGIRKKKVG